MPRLFGTDGIRGKANTYPITPEIALKVGKAVARIYAKENGTAKAIIGKDTRLSGYMLETALTSGMLSMGMDVLEIGPMPTPAVAHLVRSMGADVGVMITASHNPSDDNGIKIFSADGFKLPDEVEDRIEQLMNEDTSTLPPSKIGKAYRIEDARGRYIEFAKSSIHSKSLKGIKAVLDCANGAAYYIAPLILKELGVEVIPVSVSPNGTNINENCGATHPEQMCELVREHRADIGISLDGDADRVIFSDSNGNVVNGDRIIGLCALDYKSEGKLASNSIAVTSMSNMGLIAAMKQAGINVEITAVGDRYVIERMKAFEGKCIVQTMFMQGEFAGRSVDNTTDDYVEPWLAALREIRPEGVDIYTLARDTPVAGIKKVGPETLAAIAGRVSALGISAHWYG